MIRPQELPFPQFLQMCRLGPRIFMYLACEIDHLTPVIGLISLGQGNHVTKVASGASTTQAGDTRALLRINIIK